MTYTFDTSNLVSEKAKQYIDSKLVEELQSLFSSQKAGTTDEYNNILKNIIVIIKKHPVSGVQSPLHNQELPVIKQHKPLTEETAWGGVALKKVDVEKDFIQKLLVINRYGILGFEIHKEKYEKLKVLEGIVLLLYSNHKNPLWKEGVVSMTISAPNDTGDLPPYDEHGMIALTNCVVEETSTNHLDDLVFIFESSQVDE